MTLQSLLKKSYYHLEVTFQQEKIAKLPYYGPLIRGMLGDTFSNDNVLSEVIFKNPRIDVRPYFFYTERNGNSVTAHLMLMGFSEHFIKEVVRAIGEKETAHIGGVKCVIGAMSLKKRSFMNRRIKRRFNMKIFMEFRPPRFVQIPRYARNFGYAQNDKQNSRRLWRTLRYTQRVRFAIPSHAPPYVVRNRPKFQ